MALSFFKKKKPTEPSPADTPPPPAAETRKSPEADKRETDPEAAEATDDADAPETGTGFFAKLKKGLAKTRDVLNTDVEDLFSGSGKLDEAALERLEETLITSDIGVPATCRLMDAVQNSREPIHQPAQLKAVLKQEMKDILHAGAAGSETAAVPAPEVILILGVNGVGKTTTIGKLAARYGAEGKKVLIAAADTFRAAAIEQLTVWAERSGADIVKHRDNADPSAVVFDSLDAAIARGADVVLIDTAGRLHTKVNLMEELKKIHRTIQKKIPAAPHQTWIVLDATTGQNALSQASRFNDAVSVSGIVLTKLDGTAKGGVVIAISDALKLPIRYIGVGEQVDDLQPFDADAFIDAILK